MPESPTSFQRLWPFIEQAEAIIVVNGPRSKVLRKGQAPETVEVVGHSISVSYGDKPVRHVSRVVVSKIQAPEEAGS